MTTAGDRTVRVTSSIARAAALGEAMGRTLYLVQDSSTPSTAATIAQQRSAQGAAVFANASEVNAAYPAGSAAREAASIYFQQSPYPQPLVIGTQISVDQPNYVFGTPLVFNQAAFRALGAAGMVSLTLGSNAAVTADLSGVTDLATTAAAIQAALRTLSGSFTTATVTVVGTSLVVQVPQAGDIGQGFADTPPTRSLGLFGNDVQVFSGLAAETVTAALDRIETQDDSWYYLAVDAPIYGTAANATAIANWVAARTKMFAQDSTEGQALVANDATSALAQVSALGQARVFGFYSAYADHKALSLCARMSAVDYDRPASFLTAKFRALPGCRPDVLTIAQIDELIRKRVNYYVRQHGLPIVAEGTAYSGWIDERLWLDWFVSKMARDMFAELVAGHIPQTTAGMAALLNAARRICDGAVNSGWLAPGQVSSSLTREIQQATGNRDFDGFLSTGYLVYAAPIATQALADRQGRIAPPISVWLKGAGAIQSVDIAVLFEG